jgi:hypothetical protein
MISDEMYEKFVIYSNPNIVIYDRDVVLPKKQSVVWPQGNRELSEQLQQYAITIAYRFSARVTY